MTAYEADKEMFKKGAEDSTEENAAKALANNVTTEDMDMATKDKIRDKNKNEIKLGGSNSFMQKVVNSALQLASKRLTKPECLSGEQNKETKQNNGLTNSPETSEVKTGKLKKNGKQELLEADTVVKALNNAYFGTDVDRVKKDMQAKINEFEDAIDKATKNEKLEELKSLLEAYLPALWQKNLFRLASKIAEIGGSGDLRKA